MRISFLEDHGNFKAGQEADIPAEEAQRIINTGHAFAVMVPGKETKKVKVEKPAAKKTAAGKATGKK